MDPLIKKYLDQWPTWGLNLSTAPTLIKLFTQGKSNRNYLIQGGKHYYVLRVHSGNNAYSIDRELERLIQNAISQKKLAPYIAFQSTDNIYRVSHYIKGITGAINKTLNMQELKNLCSAVKLYQSTTINELNNLPTLVYSDVINSYWNTITHASSGITHEEEKNHASFFSLCQQFENKVKKRVLCHHDLNAENIIKLKTPQHTAFNFLDWEFSAAGIASMDFAALAVELNITTEQIAETSQIDREELNTAAIIYQYLCDLYTRANSTLQV